jgi:RNA methyltransferase, TrmH family
MKASFAFLRWNILSLIWFCPFLVTGLHFMKTTTSRSILRLLRPSSGQRLVSGMHLSSYSSSSVTTDDKYFISSKSNERVKAVQTLLSGSRRKKMQLAEEVGAELVVVEGVRAIHDALQAGLTVKFILHVPQESKHVELKVLSDDVENNRDQDLLLSNNQLCPLTFESDNRLKQQLLDIIYSPNNFETITKFTFRIDERVLRSITDTVHGQGFLAVFEKPGFNVKSFCCTSDSSLVPSARIILALDRLSDPGNMGSLLRSAYGMGVVGVLAINCCDAFSAKVTRASMAMNLRLPILELNSEEVSSVVNDIVDKSGQPWTGYQLIVADGSAGSESHFAIDYPALVGSDSLLVLMIGSEASGVLEGLYGLTANGSLRKVKIPMLRPVESFNAAVAGSIILSEITRQFHP